MTSSSESKPYARHFRSTLSAPLSPVVQGSLFDVAPDSECSELLSTVSQLASFAPEILESIERDLDAYALEKKRSRWEHQRWIEDQSQELIDLPQADMSKLKLEEGRPRMHPLAVLGFLLLRGWLGGAKDARFELMLRESVSLQIFLHNLGQAQPATSTIEENLNALSNETRERIHKAELALALEEGLEDFESLRIDSTACASASAYPTDSATLSKLVSRVCERMLKLERIELPALSGEKSDLIEEAVGEMRKLNYRISTLNSSSALQAEKAEEQEQEKVYREMLEVLGEAGDEEEMEADNAVQRPEKQGPKTKKESAKSKLRREIYVELYGKSEAVLEMLTPILSPVMEQIEQEPCSPRMRQRRETWRAAMEEDLQAIAAVIEQSRRRVCEGKKPSAKNKMPLSVSDLSASFIEKGGWEREFGYRPQCGFSAGGLVTVLIVPEGNQSDQSQLWSVVNKGIANTGVIPGVVTVDDGYTGASELIKVKGAGVEVVSFSGARGRALLGEETWEEQRYVQARRDRNGAESGIFVLKDKVRFGQLSRRGIEEVRAELLEKVLAANAHKIVELRKRKYEREHKLSWSQGLPGKRKREVA